MKREMTFVKFLSTGDLIHWFSDSEDRVLVIGIHDHKTSGEPGSFPRKRVVFMRQNGKIGRYFCWTEEVVYRWTE